MKKEHYSAGQQDRLSISHALMWIIFSTLAISGTAFLGKWWYFHLLNKKASDDKFSIVAIVQMNPEKESLKTEYLAELMDLSCDHPANLYRFNLNAAKQKLLQSPVIKTARLKKIKPGTLYVEYSLRQPYAYLSDYKNVAIDREGYIFPMIPFFTPKKLPEIYLGLPEFENSVDERGRPGGNWGVPLDCPHKDLAFKILKDLASYQEMFRVQKIDVSDAFADSYGQRQIVLFIEEQIELENQGKSLLYVLPRILRLNPSNYHESISRYIRLSKYLQKNGIRKENDPSDSLIKKKPLIIDLRLSQLAFIKEDLNQ